MKKTDAPTQGTKFTGKDADRLLAGYGRAMSPEKKAALVSKLQAERGTFEKEPRQMAGGEKHPGKER